MSRTYANKNEPVRAQDLALFEIESRSFTITIIVTLSTLDSDKRFLSDVKGVQLLYYRIIL